MCQCNATSYVNYRLLMVCTKSNDFVKANSFCIRKKNFLTQSIRNNISNIPLK